MVKVNTAGSGEHWIFRNLADDPLGNGEGVLPGGINIRGRGGFIVAPGAIRPDGMRWIEPEDNSKLITAAREDTLPEIPSWLVGMIRGHQQEQRTSSGHHSGEREFAYATAALQGECDRVAAALPGSRNNTLFKAAAALGSIAAVGWLDPDVIRSHLFEAALTCGLVRDDGNAAVRATIASGLKAGMANPHIPVSEDERFGSFGNFGTTSDEQVWGEPDPFYLGSGRSKPVHFPSDLLGSFWGDWCEAHAAARHVPVDYVAAGLLASASALVGNARWPCATPEWKEPPVLWAAIVGSPSAGKSPALDPVLGMVRQIEREAIEAEQSARVQYQEDLELAQANAAEWQRQVKEALRRGEPPPPRPSAAVDPDPVPLPRIIVGDTTPERLGVLLRDNPKGLLLNRDEMAGWLGSFGRYSANAGGERALWLEAYGGRAYTIDRQKNPEATIIPHLSIAVLGGLQPDKLGLVISGADDGFAGRFLWFWPDPAPGYRLQQKAVEGLSQLTALRQLSMLTIAKREGGSATPGYLPLSQAAAAHFEAYVADVRKRARGASGLLAGTLGKAPGHVLRLALVLEYLAWSEALWRQEPAQIGETAMLAAIGLVDGYLIPMAQRVFGEAAIPEEDRLGMELARWIMRTNPAQFNARETRRAIRGPLHDAKAMQQACEVLRQAGWIRPVGRSSGASTGRLPTNYEVNPALLKEAQSYE